MSTDLSDRLDLMIERLNAGQDPLSPVSSNPAKSETLESLLNVVSMLEVLQPVEMPPPEAMAADRKEFLAELNRLQRPSVSPAPLVRLKEWIAFHNPWLTTGFMFQRKEQRRMSTLFVKATLIFSLVFGSAGGAVALAANSLPDSPLYPAKLALEQARLNATTDPAGRAAKHLALAMVRTREMERMALAGQVPDGANLLRLQKHFDGAFSLGAELPDQELISLLSQAQPMLQALEQEMLQVRSQINGPAEHPLQQATWLLNQARRWVENGLQDPQAFRHGPAWADGDPDCQPDQDCNQNQYQNQNQEQTGPGEPCPDCEPAANQYQYQHQQQQQAGPGEPCDGAECPCPDCDPTANQNQQQDQYQRQFGPGEPCTEPDCPCPGCGEPQTHQNQQQDQYQQQTGPGEPCEEPNCPCPDCEPAGEQTQYQNGPQQTEPSGPGPNPDCPSGDCDPPGEQTQYQNGPQQTEPSGPGPNPDCPSGDCDPPGDQNQNMGPGPHDEDCPCSDCAPDGEQNQNQSGPQSEQPPDSGDGDAPPADTSPPSGGQDGAQSGGDDGGGSDDAGGGDSGGSDGSGGRGK
ncbi:MAG: hypothetical protein JSV81_03700 [Anaerolineales bacterium]|nr:MAG: hypothetical protein JSV81_03700 [Anaerolineales bacterium]